MCAESRNRFGLSHLMSAAGEKLSLCCEQRGRKKEIQSLFKRRLGERKKWFSQLYCGADSVSSKQQSEMSERRKFFSSCDGEKSLKSVLFHEQFVIQDLLLRLSLVYFSILEKLQLSTNAKPFTRVKKLFLILFIPWIIVNKILLTCSSTHTPRLSGNFCFLEIILDQLAPRVTTIGVWFVVGVVPHCATVSTTTPSLPLKLQDRLSASRLVWP